jgi:hypothetical protein
MDTKFWEVVCDEHGIGGSGEYRGDNDAHFGRIDVLCHKALSGKYGAGNFVNHTRGQKMDHAQATTKRLRTDSSDSPPCNVAAFEVN